MDIKEYYLAPEASVVEFRMECGILEASGLGIDSSNGSKETEGRQDGGDWGDGSWY